MGQKTNPNILRLGVTRHWKTEFFEKKTKELSKHTFKDLELKNFIERFLNKHNLFLHDYRQKFSNSSLIFYLSFFITSEFSTKISKINSKKLLFKRKLKKLLHKNKKKIFLISNDGTAKTLIKSNKNHYSKKHYKILFRKNFKKYLIDQNRKKFQSISKNYTFNISGAKIYHYLVNNCNLKFKLPKGSNGKTSNFKGVFLNFFKTINLFTNNNCNLVLNVSCLNKELKISTTKKNTKLLMWKLKRFQNIDFFKNGIELLLNSIINKNSAHLLVKFVAIQIKNNRKHKFFLKMIKKILTPLLKSNISILHGIKIKLKGRLNGTPRAKQKIITIGDVPVQSIQTFIDYSHHAVHSKNGTYGIKVWTALK